MSGCPNNLKLIENPQGSPVERVPLSGIESTFNVIKFDAKTDFSTTDCDISKAFQNDLIFNNFRKLVCVWGMVIAGTETF
jgi:hypothetical protein